MRQSTKPELRYARRLIMRAVREAERSGKPRDVQKILWRIIVEENRKLARRKK